MKLTSVDARELFNNLTKDTVGATDEEVFVNSTKFGVACITEGVDTHIYATPKRIKLPEGEEREHGVKEAITFLRDFADSLEGKYDKEGGGIK